jgi:hypothetical protein
MIGNKTGDPSSGSLYPDAGSLIPNTQHCTTNDPPSVVDPSTLMRQQRRRQQASATATQDPADIPSKTNPTRTCNLRGHVKKHCPDQVCKLCKARGHHQDECPQLKVKGEDDMVKEVGY